MDNYALQYAILEKLIILGRCTPAELFFAIRDLPASKPEKIDALNAVLNSSAVEASWDCYWFKGCK